ncbi:hypothetical protein [Exiguobacterium sp. S22-S28]|uniref:hypothetical protein n=1 Tax=Exiguobacterium sp. S22-S28 TaxID=3342768 RepID=UPI00372CF833
MQKDADHRIEVEPSGKKINKAMERTDRENMLEVIVLSENEIENRFREIKDIAPGERYASCIPLSPSRDVKETRKRRCSVLP